MKHLFLNKITPENVITKISTTLIIGVVFLVSFVATLNVHEPFTANKFKHKKESMRFELFFITSIAYTFYEDMTYEESAGSCISGGGKRIWGKYETRYSKILLTPFSPSSSVPEEYCIIQWGNAKILERSSDCLDVCNLYNSRLIYNASSFYEHKGPPFLHELKDSIWCFDTKPYIPFPWNYYLFDIPLIAKILEVNVDNHSIKINKGLDDNVFIGCDFYLSTYSYFTLKTTEVNKNTAILSLDPFFNRTKDIKDDFFDAVFNTPKIALYYLQQLKDREYSLHKKLDQLQTGDTVSTMITQN